MPHEQNEKEEIAVAKQPYFPPRLTVYGRVRDLTQSGSNGALEGGPNSGSSYKGAHSERRVKENIVRVGDHPWGFGLYLFDYLPEHREQWGRGRQFGVMIDEVEAVAPEAVSTHADGYKRVDYALLGIVRTLH